MGQVNHKEVNSVTDRFPNQINESNIPKIGDSSDKVIEIKAAPRTQLSYVIDRVKRGWSITPQEAKLLVNEIERFNNINNERSTFHDHI